MVMPGVISAPRRDASAKPARSVSASDPMFFTVTVSLLRRLPDCALAPAGDPDWASETLCPARVASVGHVASPRRVELSARAQLAPVAYRISTLENLAIAV